MYFILEKAGKLAARWFGPQREANRLNRDAATVIEAARATASSSRVREIALRIRDELDTAHLRGGEDPSRYAPLVAHFRTQHREARGRRDDAALTALTLVIIYLRAQIIGADAEPAMKRIDDFIFEWTRNLTAVTPPSTPAASTNKGGRKHPYRTQLYGFTNDFAQGASPGRSRRICDFPNSLTCGSGVDLRQHLGGNVAAAVVAGRTPHRLEGLVARLARFVPPERLEVGSQQVGADIVSPGGSVIRIPYLSMFACSMPVPRSLPAQCAPADHTPSTTIIRVLADASRSARAGA